MAGRSLMSGRWLPRGLGAGVALFSLWQLLQLPPYDADAGRRAQVRRLGNETSTSAKPAAGPTHGDEQDNLLLGNAELIWRPPLAVQVPMPEEIRHDYDRRCDTASPDFEMHNQEALEADHVTLHQMASRLGVARVCWSIVKLLLAILSLPGPVVEPASQWTCDDQDAKASDAAKMELPWEHFVMACERAPQHCETPSSPRGRAPFFEVVEDPLKAEGEEILAGKLRKMKEKGHLCFDDFQSLEDHLPLALSSKSWGSEEAAWLALQCASERPEMGGQTVVDLVYERRNRRDFMPVISIKELLPHCASFDKSKVESYMQFKLKAPALILKTFYMPWSIQFQTCIFLVQVLEGCVEILFTDIVGPPRAWQLYQIDWFLLTFRCELMLPHMFSLARLAVIALQWLTFTGHGQLQFVSERLIFDSRVARQLPLVAFFNYFIAAVFVLELYGQLPFLPATFLVMSGAIPVFILLSLVALVVACYAAACAALCVSLDDVVSASRRKAKDHLQLYGCLMFGLYGVTAVVMSVLMKRWTSNDTYLCTFSRLVVFGSVLDATSVGAYLVLTIVLLGAVMVAAGVAALCMAKSSIISPDTVHKMWLRSSQDLLAWTVDWQPGVDPEERLAILFGERQGEGAPGAPTAEQSPLLA